jgi:hypothetical protein
MMLFSLILNTPIKEKVSIFTLSSMNFSPEQIENMTMIIHRMKYVHVFTNEIFYIGMLLFYSLIIWLLVKLFKNKITYKRVLQLMIYAYLVIIIGNIINSGLLYWLGLEKINNQYDTLMFGLNSLTSVSTVGSTFFTFLSYINPFQIWFVFLISMGIKYLTEICWSKSFFISILFWVISIAIPIISVYFSEMASQSSVI